MRLFQNSGVYPSYLPRLRALTRNCTSFEAQVAAFLGDRFGAAHFLQPVLNRDTAAFFTNGDDDVLQRQWARENGLSANATLEAILLAQIEHHRTEVFYNIDPVRYGSAFLRKLPRCVRKSIAWRAAPSPGADFAAYDLMVCNFPSIIESYRQCGWQAQYFAPAHDAEMDVYAGNTDRPIDVLFVGGYSRHHRRRAQLLDVVAGLRRSVKVLYHLDRSRLTRLAESPVGNLLPLAVHRRPSDVRAVSQDPIFGRDLYTAISRAKIVLNGAIDMAGLDRGNMRCFEAMGCGGALLSDEGNYPQGMAPGVNLLTWRDPADAARRIRELLDDDARRIDMARAGYEMISQNYSKHRQWQQFLQLAS
nr:putative glycosyltransferase family 1 protein [uncultured bacterium]